MDKVTILTNFKWKRKQLYKGKRVPKDLFAEHELVTLKRMKYIAYEEAQKNVSRKRKTKEG